jgi:hypothetical protein
MQMRIDDELDFVRFHTGAPQPVEEIVCMLGRHASMAPWPVDFDHVAV